MGPLWARGRITELERQCYRGQNKDAEDKITQLALKHKLVTRFTSFVAVDETPTVAKGHKPMLVPVEVPIPEGTVHEGFFGAMAGGAASPQGLSTMGRSMMSAETAASAGGGMSMYKSMSSRMKQPSVPAPAQTQATAMVASLSRELLAAPSQSLARKLIALQDSKGAFHEPGADAVKAGEQALGLLALAKARSTYGSDIQEALDRAWKALKAQTGSKEDCAATVKKTLQDKGLWNASVAREYEAAVAVLKAVQR
jgi:hypothetical protein